MQAGDCSSHRSQPHSIGDSHRSFSRWRRRPTQRDIIFPIELDWNEFNWTEVGLELKFGFGPRPRPNGLARFSSSYRTRPRISKGPCSWIRTAWNKSWKHLKVMKLELGWETLKTTASSKQTMLDEAHWQSLWTNESIRLSSLPDVSYTFLRTVGFPDARAAAARFLLLYALFFFCFSSSSCAFTWRLQAVDWTNECRFCQPRLNAGSWLSLPSEVTEASSDSDSSLWKGRFAFLFFWPTCFLSFSSPSHPKGLDAEWFTNFLTDPPFSGPSFWNGGMWPSLSHHQIECQWVWNWIKDFEVATILLPHEFGWLIMSMWYTFQLSLLWLDCIFASKLYIFRTAVATDFDILWPSDFLL